MPISSNTETTIQHIRTARYIRVSTKGQEKDGYGDEAQLSAIDRFLDMQKSDGYVSSPDLFYKDVLSGEYGNRPAMNRLKQDVKAGKVDAVIAWKIDRYGRNRQEMFELHAFLRSHNVEILRVTERMDFYTPVGEFVFCSLTNIGALERRIITMRTRSGKIASARAGNYTGSRVPYGYIKIKNTDGRGSKLYIKEDEKPVVERIFHLYVYEDMGGF